MKKVAINKSYGGFHLSREATLMYLKKKYPDKEVTFKSNPPYLLEYRYYLDGKEINDYYIWDPENREDPALISTVEELGDKATCYGSKIKIVEIPDDVEYTITDYYGMEKIEEVHRVWD